MLIEGEARSIGELISEAQRIREHFKSSYEAREEIWFRGQSSCDWTLLPDLYRPDTLKYHYSESTLVDRFVALATPLLPRPPASHWDWYFLARHHGLPSRLLDWTESLFIASYFAMTPHFPSDRLQLDALVNAPLGESNYETCPSVWILDAGSLNDVSIGHDAVIVPGGPKSEPYLPDELLKSEDSRNQSPIAILPARSNARIVAQHGMFTLHGIDQLPIDVLAADRKELKLGRVRIDRASVPRMAADLRTCGVHRLTAFPDLDSVAHHVCWVSQSAV